MSKYPSRCKAFVRIVSLHETVRWAPQEEGQNAGHDPDQVQHPLSIAVLDGCLAAAQDAPEPAQKASRKAIEKRASFYNSLEKRKRSARRRDDRARDGRAIEIDRVRLSSRLKVKPLGRKSELSGTGIAFLRFPTGAGLEAPRDRADAAEGTYLQGV